MKDYFKNIALIAFSVGTLAFQSCMSADFNPNPNWQGNLNPPSFNQPNLNPPNFNQPNLNPPNFNQPNFNPNMSPNYDGEFSEHVYWQGNFNPASYNHPLDPPLGAGQPDHYDVVYRYNHDLNVYRDSTYMNYDDASRRCEDLKKYRDVHECEVKWWFNKPYHYQPRIPG